ncbi:MAG: DUF389 domain-containing protein [Anaerolineales bacterium]
MSQFNANVTPDDPDQLPPARRRRARRLLAPMEADDRVDFLDKVAHRASPSFDFFLFSLLAAAVIAVGFLLDSQPILVLSAILAPMMAPVIGIALGMVVGSVQFFLRSLVGLLIGSLLVFLVGVLAGYASSLWSPLDFTQAHASTQLSWAMFVLVALGAALTSSSMLRSEKSAALPSVALAYGLYLPVSAAGLGLGSGEPFLFPDGLVVFVQYLSGAVLVAAVTFILLGFRPLTLFGYTVGAVVLLFGIVVLIGISGAGVSYGAQIALPTQTPSLTPSPTLTLTPTPIPPTPRPPTATASQTVTPTLTASPTGTPSPTPTPILALIDAEIGGGAHLRSEPGFSAPSIKLLLNGTPVQIMPDAPVEEGGGIWIHVRTFEGDEGWILQILLLTATPAPNWDG